MATIHNEAGPEQIASVVLMPGDPLRAKLIAKEYMERSVLFNRVRNMFGYTGWYKGHRISVMGGGMGCPSTGIYAHELYCKYGVDTIIRVGSCGAFSERIAMRDLLLIRSSWSESSFARAYSGFEGDTVYPSVHISGLLEQAARHLGHILKPVKVHTADSFYKKDREVNFKIRDQWGCEAEEMESFALFHVAAEAGKEAAALLTVSDHALTKEEISTDDRQKSFHNMIETALAGAVLRLEEFGE